MGLKRVSAVGVVLFGGVLLAAEQAPIFRSQPNFVELAAIVTDRSNRFIPELTADDFEIREDGALQSIVSFTYSNLPRSPAPPIVFRSDVPASERMEASRLYVLYLDEVSIDFIVRTRQQARDFVERFMQPSDGAILLDGWSPSATANITNDKRELLAQINRFGRSDAANQPPRQVPASGRGTAVDWLNAVQGRRKSLILFTENLLDPGVVARSAPAAQFAWGGISKASFGIPGLRDLMERADMHVYPCDVRGLAMPESYVIVGRPAGPGNDYPVHRVDTRSGYLALTADAENMKSVAAATGGLALVNLGDCASGFQRIVDDNSRYYLLGYESSSGSARGVLRELNVTVKRPGLKVRARTGFVRR